MNSIDLIRENLTRSAELVLLRVEEMRDFCLVAPTPKGGAHTLWLIGHLAFIEGLVVHGFGLGEANPLNDWEEIFDGSEISENPDDYPPFDEVLEQCRSMRRTTLELLDARTEDDLDRVAAKVPSGYDDLFGTERRCFQFVADHWYMHRGQLADARRAAGLERMWL